MAGVEPSLNGFTDRPLYRMSTPTMKAPGTQSRRKQEESDLTPEGANRVATGGVPTHSSTSMQRKAENSNLSANDAHRYSKPCRALHDSLSVTEEHVGIEPYGLAAPSVFKADLSP